MTISFFDNVLCWLKCGQHVYVSSNALGFALFCSHQLLVRCNIAAAKAFEELLLFTSCVFVTVL